MSQPLSTPGMIRTYTGRYINLLEPETADIALEDIAWALSNECRFNGHTDRFYSVAEHSLFCAELAPAPWKLTMLLHDATEAYLKDLPKPLKMLPQFAFYLELEARWAASIGLRFGVHLEPLHKELKAIDKAMLVREQQLLMGRAPGYGDVVKPADVDIPLEPPTRLAMLFRAAFTRYGGVA